MVAITYHHDLKEVQGDPVLARLLASPAQCAPFDRLQWWQGLVDHCGIVPLVAIAREGDAITVLPLAQTPDGLEALANWYSFRTRPILSEWADASRLLTALARDLRRDRHRIILNGMPDENGEATVVANAFRTAGWATFVEACDTNHVLDVAGRSFASYLAERPGPLRTTLQRRAKKLEVTLFRRFDAAAWADYEDIYRESWKPGEGSPEFLRQFAHTEGAAGRLRLGLAFGEVAGSRRAIAAQFWTVEGGTAFIHKLAHRQTASALSPGTALTAALFEEVIDRDCVTLVDFGTGNDAYKRDWMERQRPRYRLTLLRPEAPRNWPHLLKLGVRRLAAAGKPV